MSKDYLFYDIAIRVALYQKQFDRAFAWSDSIGKKFPNDKLFFYDRASIYATLGYYTKTDSASIKKNRQLYADYLRKTKEPGLTTEVETKIDNLVDIALAGLAYNEKDYKTFVHLTEEMSTKSPLNAGQYNLLAYVYIEQKKYNKAEDALKKAVFMASDVGDYWDSLAELYSIQGKDSLAVVNLEIALKCPQKTAAVSVEAYKKDARWKRLQKRADFNVLLARDSSSTARKPSIGRTNAAQSHRAN